MSKTPSYMPPSIQKRADALAKQAFGDPDAPATATVTQEPPAPVTPTPAPVPVPTDDASMNQPPVTQAEPTPATPPATSEPQPAGEDSEVERLKQELQRTLNAHSTLQGKFRSEDKARQEAAAAHAENQRLQQELNQLRAAVQNRPAAPQQPAFAGGTGAGIDPKTLFDDQTYRRLSENYGEEDLNLLVNGLARGLQSQFDQRLSEVVRPVSERMERQQGDQFLSALAVAVGPDYNAIGDDPAFNAWLNMPTSDYSDQTRLDALAEARRNNNVFKAAKLFQDFGKLRPKASASTGSTPVKTPPIESLVQPGGTGSGTPRNVPQTPTDTNRYAGAQIAEMSARIASGKVVGKQALDLQNVINRAIAEGRIV